MINKAQTQPISPQQTVAVTGLLGQRYAGVVLDDQRRSRACQALLVRGRHPTQLCAQAGNHALNYLHDEALADHMFVAALERSPADKDYAGRRIASVRRSG